MWGFPGNSSVENTVSFLSESVDAIPYILIVTSRASQAGHASLSRVISSTKACLPI